MCEWGIVIVVVLLILGGIGYSIYRRRLLKKKVKSFENSLVELQTTVNEAILSCKKSLPPPVPHD